MDLKAKVKIGLSVARYNLNGTRIPIAVAWLITGRCNLACEYCQWKDLRQSEELDTKQALDMIDQMKRAGTQLISITGGEPLLRKDIGQIVKYIKRQGMVCKLNTNGVLLDERRLAELSGLDLLQVSLDGPPDVHDRLRGEGSAMRAVRAIVLAKSKGIKVQLIACLTRENVERIDEVLDYGLELGVGFYFQILTPQPLNAEEIDRSVPDRESLANTLRYLLKLKRSKRGRGRAVGSSESELLYYLDMVEEQRRGCDCALVTATMLPDGKLIFCGNRKEIQAFDTKAMGFSEAFSKLTTPDCDGCVCVGKLRLSKVFRLDTGLIKEMIKL